MSTSRSSLMAPLSFHEARRRRSIFSRLSVRANMCATSARSPAPIFFKRARIAASPLEPVCSTNQFDKSPRAFFSPLTREATNRLLNLPTWAALSAFDVAAPRRVAPTPIRIPLAARVSPSPTDCWEKSMNDDIAFMPKSSSKDFCISSEFGSPVLYS